MLYKDIEELSYEQGGNLFLSIESSQSLAAKYGLFGYQIDIKAIEKNIIPIRYFRNFYALDLQEQLNLLRSKVAIVGLGGLGGFILELLARTGVGSITAADGDFFQSSNLNRQLYSRNDNIGQLKTKAAQERINQINPGLDFQIWQTCLQENDYQVFLKDKDLVIDALGGLEVRQVLLQQATQREIPMISGAVAGELACVSTVYPGDAGPSDLWEGQTGAEEYLGCLAHSVALVASMQGAEAVHIMAGRDPILRNKMAVCDLKDFSWQVFEL